ncbi:MAG: hypothetical protein P1P64_07260 [Treponemataceae bacterium]
MKKFKQKLIVLNLAVLLLAIIIAFFAFPTVYKSFYTFVNKKSEEFFAQIKNAVGLDIRYEKFSPSFLKKINFENISVMDENGNKIASFEKVLIDYKFLELINSNFDNAIKHIIIRDGYINYDENNKSSFFEKIFSTKKTADQSDSTGELNEKKSFSLENFEIPVKNFNISLQNIFFRIYCDDFFVKYTIYSAKLVGADDRINYNINSQILASVSDNPNLRNIQLDIKLNGNALTDLSKLSAIVNLNNIASETFSLANTAFFLSLDKTMLSLLAFQRNESLDIKANYDIEKKLGSFSANFADIKISNLLHTSNKDLETFKSLSFTGLISADFDLNEDAKEKIKYNTNLTVKSPSLSFDKIITKNIRLNLKTKGTENYISVENLYLGSNLLDFSVNGFYNFANGRLSANAYINKLLVNNNNIKTKVSVSGTKTKYICNLTEIELGNGGFEDISISLIPHGKVFDIATTIKDNEGDYNFDASYVLGSKNTKSFLELHGILNSISVLNIYKIASSFLSMENNSFLENKLEPFRATSEFYVTSDLESFSYNVVQLILASTEAGGAYLLSSFGGSNNSFNLQNLNLNIAQKQLTGTANANFGNEGDVFFDSLFSVDAISYSVNGIIANNMVNIYGDYGLSLTAFLENKSLNGNFTLKEFPVPALPLVFSINSNFTFSDKKNWQVICDEAKLVYSEEALIQSYTDIPFQLAFKGSINPKNIFLSEIEMGNSKSTIKGQAAFDAISTDYDILKQFSVVAKLEDEQKTQSLDLNSNFSIADEIFADGFFNVKNLSLATFSNKQAKTDAVTANINFLGSLENLLLQARLENLKMHLNNKPLEASALFLIDDGTVKIPEAHFNWDGHDISSVDLNFVPESGIGKLDFKYAGLIAGKETRAEISSKIEGQKVLPSSEQTAIEKILSTVEAFVLDTTIKKANLGNDKLKKPFTFTVTRDEGVVAFYDNENKMTGFYLDDGTVSLSMSEDFKTRLSLDGSITKDTISLQCYSIHIDLLQVLSLVNLGDYVAFTSGNINGELLIDGKLNEPKFYGTLFLDDANFHSPGYAPDNLYANNVPISFSEYMLEMPHTDFVAKTFILWVECTSEFDGWIPYETIVRCGIDKNRPGHMKTKNLLFHADGKVFCDVLMKITPTEMNLTGSANFDKGAFSIAFDTFDEFAALTAGSGFDFSMDLDVELGNKAEFNWPNMRTPVLRTLAPTSEPVVFHVTPSTFTITGLANLRGGEITYIKRNFYIKEGNIKFIETLDGFSPLLSLRAEIRDKDVNGKPVKLILTLQDQALIDNTDAWISKITSDPAKSETEIMQLFGQMVTGDMNKETLLKDTLTNATDLAAQFTFTKTIENSIRDFLRLDVLSLRTQVVQNLVFGNLFKTPEQESLKIGDYLDNTSLYMGKYFGSAIYADAALHLNNYDPLNDPTINVKKPIFKSIMFQPELGLEMATPFFNLRFAISPINVDTLFVNNTSLTFSWNFSY